MINGIPPLIQPYKGILGFILHTLPILFVSPFGPTC
jgi:hypothetical protein